MQARNLEEESTESFRLPSTKIDTARYRDLPWESDYVIKNIFPFQSRRVSSENMLAGRQFAG